MWVLNIVLLATVASAAPVQVASKDGTVALTFLDSSSPPCARGKLSLAGVKAEAGGGEFDVSATTAPDGGQCVSSSIEKKLDGSVIVTFNYSVPGLPDMDVVTIYTATNTSVRFQSTVSTTSSTPFGVPVITSFQLTKANTLKLWAPWDRDSISNYPPTVDPLLPSDGHLGWWNGSYAYGNRQTGEPDMIIAPVVSILDDNHTMTALSAVLDPTEDSILEMVMRTWMEGAAGGFYFNFTQLRFQDGIAHTFFGDFIGHDACFRPALAFSGNRYPDLWYPTTAAVQDLASGLGSYSWYLGDLTSPNYTAVNYKVNWDLSGRFFPYMGQFLPPVEPGDMWLNDVEGTQPRANVSFGIIDEYYGRIQSQGFNTLSYFNIFEYGINTNCFNSSAKGNSSNWPNAMDYLVGTMPDAPFHRTWDPRDGVHEGCWFTWQKGIVMDPSTPSYHQFLQEQIQRKLDHLPHFQGIVVDRSDWNKLYNLEGDDGISWAAGGPAYSMKRAYIKTMSDIRDMLVDARGDENIMLINTFGYSMLSLMGPYDGSFSEGKAVSAVGLLGLFSPAILWVYSADECCKTPELADTVLQWHLYMGVFPMAPFPGNDHAIPPNPDAQVAFELYGKMFESINRRLWVLDANPVLAPHCKPNAFDIEGNSTVRVFPIMLCPASSSVTVEILLAWTPMVIEQLLPGASSWTQVPWKRTTREHRFTVSAETDSHGALMIRAMKQ